jgi:hypothetical protein
MKAGLEQKMVRRSGYPFSNIKLQWNYARSASGHRVNNELLNTSGEN